MIVSYFPIPFWFWETTYALEPFNDTLKKNSYDAFILPFLDFLLYP